MNKKQKPSKLIDELSAEEVSDILTFITKFHHYASADKDLLPSVRRDWMKKSFMLRCKIEAFVDDMEA